MTHLSINLNKIALLRNSRGRDYPNVVAYADKFLKLGVQGITIHPRPDERHAKWSDAVDLAKLLTNYPDAELNIEGYPSADFLTLSEQTRPHQCTLVPDDANQLTSDHGWDIADSHAVLMPALKRLKDAGIRSSLFLDPNHQHIKAAAAVGCERIELYTEQFAHAFHHATVDKSAVDEARTVFNQYKEVACYAQSLGLGVNAGHDLDRNNLARFLEIADILEVSIGHALTIECLDEGMEKVVAEYLQICAT